MAAPLAKCTKEEQRSVIRFLSSEVVKPIEIHGRMKVQYGDASVKYFTGVNTLESQCVHSFL